MLRKLLGKRTNKPKTPRLQHVFVLLPDGGDHESARMVAETSFTGLFTREDRSLGTDVEKVSAVAGRLYRQHTIRPANEEGRAKIWDSFPNRWGQFGVDQYVPVVVKLPPGVTLSESPNLRSLTETGYGKQIRNLLDPDVKKRVRDLAGKVAAE